MSTAVTIVGAGLSPFGRHPLTGRQQGVRAMRMALADAGLEWSSVQAAFGGSDSAGNADAMVRDLGLSGIPFVNVANGCATGGSALAQAHRSIQSGEFDVVAVVGFDKHPPGAFNADPSQYSLDPWYGETGLMLTTQFFAMKTQRYLAEHGISRRSLARVASKAFSNGSINPNAWRRQPFTEDEVLASTMVSDPLTQYMFCSPAEGAAALVLARPGIVDQSNRPQVRLESIALRSRRYGSFEVFAPSLAPDRADGPTVDASTAALEAAGIAPQDIDVAQLQDTDAGAELMHMAECGFCEHGAQEELIASGWTQLSGGLPVNTDGGCLANGEPIGASGLRQVYESVVQLRGEAGERQVPNARTAFTHVYGAPGISACTVLSR